MTSLHIFEESASAITTATVVRSDPVAAAVAASAAAVAVDESDDVDPLPDGYRYVRIGQRGLILNHIETG